MDAARDLRHAPGAASLRDWWLRHGDRLLLLAIISMVTLASLKLGAEAYRSVLGQQPADAVDLLARQSETRLWFSAQAVYVKPGHQTYPPASFAMLWPMVGWLPPAELRWVWAISGLLALIWLARLAVRESGASSRFERLFMGALPFAMTSTATTIGQGQLLVHLLPLAIAGLLLLWRGPASLRCDLLGAGLLLLALIKPTATVPFAVLALFAPGRLRPAALIAVGYLALTLLACAWQPRPLPELFRAWRATGESIEVVQHGYANLHLLAVSAGLAEFRLIASLLALTGLGVWLYRHREVDLWLLLGITAIVARLWAHHYFYDDLLILLPIIALFRLARTGSTVAGLLVALNTAMMVTPARILALDAPWGPLVQTAYLTTWIASLLLLADQVRRGWSPNADSRPAAACARPSPVASS